MASNMPFFPIAVSLCYPHSSQNCLGWLSIAGNGIWLRRKGSSNRPRCMAITLRPRRSLRCEVAGTTSLLSRGRRDLVDATGLACTLVNGCFPSLMRLTPPPVLRQFHWPRTLCSISYTALLGFELSINKFAETGLWSK